MAPHARQNHLALSSPRQAGRRRHGRGLSRRRHPPAARRCVEIPVRRGADERRQQARFLHEAQAAASLDHPNICGIFEIGEAEGRLFMAMPFIEGSGLDKRIAEGPRPVSEIIEIAIQTAEALEEAHGKQIVHRDIKPANIMVQQRGRGRLHCVLMDFGKVGTGSGKSLVLSPGRGVPEGTATRFY